MQSLNTCRSLSPLAAAAAAGSSAESTSEVSCCSHQAHSSLKSDGIVRAQRVNTTYARRATYSKSCAGKGAGGASHATAARVAESGPYCGAHGRASTPTPAAAAAPQGAAEPKSARKNRPAWQQENELHKEDRGGCVYDKSNMFDT